MPSSFVELFKTGNAERDNFLSRVFAICSEEPVRIWALTEQAPYAYLGRPTLKRDGETRGSTLDFALQSKADGRVLVAEQKCELAFSGYQYLVLNSVDQVQRHIDERKEAFLRFVAMAKDPSSYNVTVSDAKGRCRSMKAAGAVLIWGAISEAGKHSVMERFGFADVLSVEAVIANLVQTKNPIYREYVARRRCWCDELFRGMHD